MKHLMLTLIIFSSTSFLYSMDSEETRLLVSYNGSRDKSQKLFSSSTSSNKSIQSKDAKERKLERSLSMSNVLENKKNNEVCIQMKPVKSLGDVFIQIEELKTKNEAPRSKLRGI